MTNNKTALAFYLFFAALFFLGGGMAIGIYFSGQERVSAPAEQASILMPAIAAQNATPLLVDVKAPQEPQLLAEAKLANLQVKAKPGDVPLPPVFELPAAPKAPIAGVPVVEQKSIDDAIAKGMKYLKTRQNLNGTWGAGAVPQVGYTALPALTLLECGVAPTNPVVQKAAAFVRKNIFRLDTTYELSLAILLLDRLGEPRDRALIRTMALRLVAGQTAAGGWNYRVALRTEKELDQLYTFLDKTRPYQPTTYLLTIDKKINTSKNLTTTGNITNRTSALTTVPPVLNNETKGAVANVPAPKIENPPPPVPNAKVPDPDQGPAVKKIEPKNSPALKPDFLPAHLRGVPAVANQGKGKGKGILKAGRDDNSNSQFAMLGLWTARRHGVPTEQTLLLAYQRYVYSQLPGGGWYYTLAKPEQTQTMTCVGLLGLAMGQGSAPLDGIDGNGKPQKSKVVGKTLNEDPAIQSGLKALGSYIGQPGKNKPTMENLYFLWSVERVAMLYDLKTIGGKDWYGWGSRILVAHQAKDGTWQSTPYPGHSPTVDTCFALLFLKRSNLVQDLTDNLQLFMAISDPDAQKKK